MFAIRIENVWLYWQIRLIKVMSKNADINIYFSWQTIYLISNFFRSTMLLDLCWYRYIPSICWTNDFSQPLNRWANNIWHISLIVTVILWWWIRVYICICTVQSMQMFRFHSHTSNQIQINNDFMESQR